MKPVTIKTSAGPVRVGTELGNPGAPVHVVLGQGIMSVGLFLTVDQAGAIAAAVVSAMAEALGKEPGALLCALVEAKQ